MAQRPTTGFDLEQTDRLLMTTKQVRKRLDLTRPVPYDELLECIDLANRAPMGGRSREAIAAAGCHLAGRDVF